MEVGVSGKFSRFVIRTRPRVNVRDVEQLIEVIV